ncbi:hypothetical protein [Psychrobacter sanguinis]|uniref:hypothetical protein n=1 Tax=Psychrobacter sanguinis TaxID=861445 RepID=UPI00020C7AC4|nr:hypothetical protein [Psychrobacter sanguinis]EGK11738.1 hypothetical protein HMPREF9373_1694 [Psychrobacter sp. 1501(2011)]MCD9151725.1 hypothetical protein [Psychrobacter sanguinis]
MGKTSNLQATDFTRTVQESHKANELDEAISGIFNKLIKEYELENLVDMNSYGTPWLESSPVVIERFSKLNGLVILRQDADGLSTDIMAMILSSWQAMASGRGLAFLQFVLDMLFPGNNRVLRLWHSKELANSYPVAVSEKEMPGSFLTSRVRIALTLDDNNSDISDIAPVLEKLVPWHIVPEIAVSNEFGQVDVAVAVGGYRYHVAYLSPF